MKVKLKDLWNAMPVLQKISAEKMEFKLSYRIMKILKAIEIELKNIDVYRVKLVEKYAAPLTEKEVAEHKAKKVDPAHTEEFVKEFDEFLEDDTEVNIQKIPMDLVENNLKVSAQDLMVLEKFIDIPQEIKG